MRISFIIQDLFALGAQYVTASIIRGFVSRNYDVDLIVSKVHADLGKNKGMKAFEVPESVNWIILPSRKARKNIFAIRTYLKTTDSAAVIAMSSNYTQALSIASIGLRHRPKIMHVEHSSTIGVTFLGECISSTKFIDKVKSWLIYSNFDLIATVSAGTSSGFKRVNPWIKKEIHTLYNPVVDNIFLKKLHSAVQVHKWLENKKYPTFIAAGAHTEFKNHMMLLEAVRIANQRRPVRLILFGKGELTESYIEFVKKIN